ncbi:hypothetical protein BDR07DRAFT_1377553 [Suillus spraguei]|nr:hypothetical protein BDR07DRAFT_1377553 [Suillus spraguei]
MNTTLSTIGIVKSGDLFAFHILVRHRFDSVVINTGQTEVIGWQILGWFKHITSELRKVIKGTMTPITNFCDATESGRKEEITRLVKLFNSEHRLNVQTVISEVVVEQAFAELLWSSMFIPIGGLADGIRSVRLADFFPEDICTSTRCLAQDIICNLMILLYQTMLLILKNLLGKGRTKELAIYLDHRVMPDVLMATLGPMHENVLNFKPKMKVPRTIGKTKQSRTMADIRPITIKAVEGVGLPNNAGFQSFSTNMEIWNHYQRFAQHFPLLIRILTAKDNIYSQHYACTWLKKLALQGMTML